MGANASSGTLNPKDTKVLTWVGTGTAGGALNDLGLGVIGDNETLCREGENCDTFMPTLSGSPSDWKGKYARIEITWGLPATDYDLYVRKGSPSGPVVANSGRGATSPSEPLTQEDVNLDVEALGTGTYAVRVIYYAATSADQYRGSARVTARPCGSSPRSRTTRAAESLTKRSSTSARRVRTRPPGASPTPSRSSRATDGPATSSRSSAPTRSTSSTSQSRRWNEGRPAGARSWVREGRAV